MKSYNTYKNLRTKETIYDSIIEADTDLDLLKFVVNEVIPYGLDYTITGKTCTINKKSLCKPKDNDEILYDDIIKEQVLELETYGFVNLKDLYNHFAEEDM